MIEAEAPAMRQVRTIRVRISGPSQDTVVQIAELFAKKVGPAG
jgi:hypothetical protein